MWSCLLSFFVILTVFLQLVLGRPQDPTNDPQSPKITKHSINKTRGGLTDFHSMGKFAKPDQFPGMVSLRYSAGQHFCCGSIVGSDWVLTAARCVDSFRGDLSSRGYYKFTIIAGEYKLVPAHQAQNKHLPKQIHTHPHHKNYDNDLALIKVDKPFKISKYIKILSLPKRPVLLMEACQVAGWGSGMDLRSVEEFSRNEPLRYLDVKILEAWIPGIASAGDMHTENVFCHGDYGTGLICKDLLAGFAISGSWNCDQGAGTYTTTHHYADWIKRMTGTRTKGTLGFGAGTQTRSNFLLVLVSLLIFCSTLSTAVY